MNRTDVRLMRDITWDASYKGAVRGRQIQSVYILHQLNLSTLPVHLQFGAVPGHINCHCVLLTVTQVHWDTGHHHVTERHQHVL